MQADLFLDDLGTIGVKKTRSAASPPHSRQYAIWRVSNPPSWKSYFPAILCSRVSKNTYSYSCRGSIPEVSGKSSCLWLRSLLFRKFPEVYWKLSWSCFGDRKISYISLICSWSKVDIIARTMYEIIDWALQTVVYRRSGANGLCWIGM